MLPHFPHPLSRRQAPSTHLCLHPRGLSHGRHKYRPRRLCHHSTSNHIWALRRTRLFHESFNFISGVEVGIDTTRGGGEEDKFPTGVVGV